MKTVFITHASVDRPLALLMKQLISNTFQVGRQSLSCFCSSDIGDIEAGKHWFNQILEKLRKANICIAIMTPQSLYYSPWVAYEFGGAYMKFAINPKQSRLFPVCAYGIRGGDLPSPFNELQARDLSNSREVWTLSQEIAKALVISTFRKPRSIIQKVVSEASNGSPYWSYVSRALVGQRQASSPFSLDAILKQAKTTLFCAGFNLHHVATRPEVKKTIFDFLRDTPTKTVKLLVSDPNKFKEFAAWQCVGQNFLADLQESVANFKEWISDSTAQKLEGKLDIRCAEFIPLTVIAIDPDASHAQIVLTPNVPQRPLGVERPNFWLSRKNQPAVFAHYWDSYNDLFTRAKPI